MNKQTLSITPAALTAEQMNSMLGSHQKQHNNTMYKQLNS